MITPVRLDGRTLILNASNQVVREWVSTNYPEELQSALNEGAGKKSELEIA